MTTELIHKPLQACTAYIITKTTKSTILQIIKEHPTKKTIKTIKFKSQSSKKKKINKEYIKNQEIKKDNKRTYKLH